MAVLDKNGTEYLWNKAKEKFAAKDDVPETPEGVVLYTEQSLTDSQKAQARGNIGAVGTVEATEEAYTYVFTGEEEVYDAGGGAFYVHMDGVSEEFISNAYNGVLESQGQQVTYAEIFEGKDFRFIKSLQSNDNVHFYTDEYQLETFMCVLVEGDLKVGAYWLKIPESLAVISLTSTVPYTKTTQKIDEALIPDTISRTDHAHSWEELEDKPFGDVVTYREVLEEQEFTGEEDAGIFFTESTNFSGVTSGTTDYIVVYDGEEYPCKAITEETMVSIGNMALLDMGENTGEPFGIIMFDSDGYGMIGLLDTNVHTISVFAKGVKVNRLSNKYVNADWISFLDENFIAIAEEQVVEIVSGEVSHALANYDFDSLGGLGEKIFRVIWNGKEYLTTVNQEAYENNRCYYKVIGNTELSPTDLGIHADTSLPFLMNFGRDSELVTIVGDTVGTALFSVYIYDGETRHMPECFLPESVSGVIIRSSTSGSTKKFKLTVDDTGTISATEVV